MKTLLFFILLLWQTQYAFCEIVPVAKVVLPENIDPDAKAKISKLLQDLVTHACAEDRDLLDAQGKEAEERQEEMSAEQATKIVQGQYDKMKADRDSLKAQNTRETHAIWCYSAIVGAAAGWMAWKATAGLGWLLPAYRYGAVAAATILVPIALYQLFARVL